MIPLLNLQKLYSDNRSRYQEIFDDIASRCAFIGGKEVEQFEKAFSNWVKPGFHCVGVANGTDAIEMAVRGLGLKPGEEAIAPAMTYVATVEALIGLGLKVKLVDVDSKTALMDLSQLRKAVSKNTRLIIPVHLYGQMAPMDEIRGIADSVGAFVVEDSSQAHGAKWRGESIGKWSHAATFSFYPGKNLGAFGDAGAVISFDPEFIQRVRAIGNHGGIKKYEHTVLGRNSRLDNLQAAFLLEKLNFIDTWNESRRRIAGWYAEGLSDIEGLELPSNDPHSIPVYHLYVVKVDDREAFRKYLSDNGVETGIHYPAAIHQLPAMQSFVGGVYPEAERLAGHGVSLPMCPTLTTQQASMVVKTIRAFFMR